MFLSRVHSKICWEKANSKIYEQPESEQEPAEQSEPEQEPAEQPESEQESAEQPEPE